MWTLIASYTETEVERTSLELGVVSIGWNEVSSATNNFAVSGVSAEVASELTEDKSQTLERVSDYFRTRQQQQALSQGAKLCKTCQTLFYPTAEKLWTGQGFCSKLCGVKAGAITDVMIESPAALESTKRTIEVSCPGGHVFEVLPTFSGCLRPCPQCGAKCPVP